jgi:uncharacterized protein (DUF488 family)
MQPKIVTIGVYGFSEPDFFAALLESKVDTFVDIRRRRGLRGSLYPFANSARLQQRLGDLGIRYIHLLELAPSEAVRDFQRDADDKSGLPKRARARLSEEFVRAYEAEHLSKFDAANFLEAVGPEAKVICLFCVEGQPEACHRSRVAGRLASDLGLQVEHITP